MVCILIGTCNLMKVYPLKPRYESSHTGNKCDLEQERFVKPEEAIEFAHQNKLFYL